ncbi:MAG: thioredoxin-disulfide reductase [Alphaproteobacteria bacterium]|nr:MAG: thioredoxin-disulfide reductase [Alphaproteobacteria bacterium]
MAPTHTKVLIIGSGPAGYTAAIYAARAALDPILVQGMEPGGQLTVTTDVENYPGFAEVIQGPWLMEQMEKQARHVGVVPLFDRIKKVDFSRRPFTAESEFGELFTADTVIICTGAQAKWLGIPSEEKFRGHGVSGCATCDGFFFKEKHVAVIGGGNTAVEEALYLTNHAAKVTLIHRRDTLRAEKVLQDRLFAHEKITVLWNHHVKEFQGEESPRKLKTLVLESTNDKSTQKLSVSGAFVAIGHAPQTTIFADQLQTDEQGYLICAPGSTKTAIPGVFAAGDVQDKVFRQAVTAAGQGCMAALEASHYLASQK